MSNFGSYVKALRKASTHLTEEPFILPYIGRTRYYPKHNKSPIQHLWIRLNSRPLPYYII